MTNLGLKLIPVAPHLLLQSTDIMWTILFAHLLNREQLDRYELLCCIGTAGGSVLIAIRTHETIPALFPIVVNLASPLVLGLCVSELRRATRVLLIENSAFDGKVPFMDAFELTAFKLWFSSMCVLPFAIFFEARGIMETKVRPDGETSSVFRPSVVDALKSQR